MKRIVISLTNDIQNDRRMTRSAQTLMDHGHQVEIVCRNLQGTVNESPYPIHYINCWFSNGLAFYFEFNIRLFFRLIRLPTDVLVSVDSDTLLASTFASIIRQNPLVIDMHELFAEVPELQGQSFKKWVWKCIESFGIHRSRKRYTVSATIAEKYHAAHHKPFEIIRNVPPITAEVSGKKNDRFTLVYLGVLNQGRGIEILFDAIKVMPEVDLILLGEGDISNKLRHLSNTLNIESQVRFYGWIAPEEIPALLSTAHVGVNLLDPRSQSYYLSLANKYFDYIHSGLPIISMNFPEYRKLNQEMETSVLIDELNAQKIHKAISQLLNDPEHYDQLKTNCIKARQIWNWDKESKALLSIFDF